MRVRLLAALIAGSLAAPLAAQQVATVVVQPESLPGPQLVARNPDAPVQLRAVRSGSTLQLEAVARDPQSCLRGVSASLAGGPALAIEPNLGAWIPNVALAAAGSGRSSTSSVPAVAPPVQQNQPPGPPHSTTQQASSRRINLGLGLALGTALFDRLRERCEPAIQARITLPADADLERLSIEVQLAPRAAPSSAAPAAYSFGLRAAEGMLVGSAPPARAVPP